MMNEVLASNVSGLLDENGDTSDWLELHNHSNAEVNLTGWGLSDNRLNPFKWKFRDGRIPAGGFLTVFASGKDRHPELHAALDPTNIPGVVLWLNAGTLNTNDSNQIRRVGCMIFVRQWSDSSSRKAHGQDAGAGISMGTNGVAVFEHGSGYIPALASYPSRLGSEFHIITVQYANRHPQPGLFWRNP